MVLNVRQKLVMHSSHLQLKIVRQVSQRGKKKAFQAKFNTDLSFKVIFTSNCRLQSQTFSRIRCRCMYSKNELFLFTSVIIKE